MWVLVSDYIGSLVSVISSIIFCKIILNKEVNINKFFMCLLVVLISVLLEIFYLLEVDVIKSLLSFVLLFLSTYYDPDLMFNLHFFPPLH